jgi:hypothetical protein
MQFMLRYRDLTALQTFHTATCSTRNMPLCTTAIAAAVADSKLQTCFDSAQSNHSYAVYLLLAWKLQVRLDRRDVKQIAVGYRRAPADEANFILSIDYMKVCNHVYIVIYYTYATPLYTAHLGIWLAAASACTHYKHAADARWISSVLNMGLLRMYSLAVHACRSQL